MTQRHYVPTYSFKLDDVCYCKSNKLFGECCGSQGANRKPPVGITIVNNFVTDIERKSFLRFAEKQKRNWLQTYNVKDASNTKSASRRDMRRITKEVNIGKKVKQATTWVTKACDDYINKPNVRVERIEVPQLLRYESGGLYKTHADAEQYEKETRRWYRAVDRDISMLIYLNDNYNGGELHFNALQYTYKPVAGDLVIFPSINVFRHESLPITSGVKYALVSWMVLAGTVRVSPTPVYASINL